MIDDGAKPGRATEAAVVTALPISAPAGDASTEPFASGWLGDTMELGARMGRYHLRSLVGTGGLGVVFEAWDPELDRRVAVKILRGRSEAAGGPGESRLRREGQVMARLTHPNVIRVYDVGVENGHAFVAMEFVAGGTLADWLIKRPRAPGEILAAFAQAGRGLAAAHGAGLVHRDFKPSNVLVGDDGRVLVTDFGLARVVSGEAGETPSGDAAAPHRPLAVTRTGQLVGTPAYMAPEQLVGGPIDARADQYSFCVALWRALFGTAPHEGESFDEIAAARTAGALSSPRPAAAAAIPARVREALERGLSPTPDARFASMDELLEVLAVRDARARARLVGAAVGVAAAVGAALWIGARLAGGPPAEDPCASRVDRFAGLWDLEARSAVRAAFIATGQRYAEASFGELARQLDGRRRAWERMRRDSCEATRVRREQSDRMLDMRAACLDRRLADLSAFVAELRTADAETVGRAAQEASSIGDPAGCADVDALARRAPLPGDPGKRAAVAAVERELSAVRGQLAAGRAKDAVPRAEAAVGRARETGHAPVLAQALALAGDIQAQLEHGEQAAALYREAILAGETGSDDELRFRCETALITVFGRQLERDEDGIRHAEQARALLARLGPDPRRAALLARSEADADWWNGRYAQARRRAQEAVLLYERMDPGGPDLIRALHLRAILEDELGENETALATEERARPLAERALGADHPMVAQILNGMSGPLRRLGRHEEARDALRRALRIFEAAYGPEHPRVAGALANLATIDLDEGRFEEAILAFRRVLAMFIKVAGPDNVRVALTYERLGSALSKAGHAREAEASLERAIAIHAARLGRDSPPTAMSRRHLGEHYLRTGRPKLARTTLLQSLHSIEATEGPTSPLVARPLRWLGEAEAALGRPAAAAAAYRRALAVLADRADDGGGLRAEIETALAKVAPRARTRRAGHP